jgi:hypothetical protein
MAERSPAVAKHRRKPGSASPPQTAGRPLADADRTSFEAAFGADLSGVRIHADDGSASSAAGEGANAYTVGGDIVFGAGRYAPSTRQGRLLLAHELGHVMQQRRGQATGASSDEAAAEADADRAARAAASGQPAAVAESASVAIARQPAASGDVTRSDVGDLPDEELDAEYERVRAWLLDPANRADPRAALTRAYLAQLEREMTSRDAEYRSFGLGNEPEVRRHPEIRARIHEAVRRLSERGSGTVTITVQRDRGGKLTDVTINESFTQPPAAQAPAARASGAGPSGTGRGPGVAAGMVGGGFGLGPISSGPAPVTELPGSMGPEVVEEAAEEIMTEAAEVITEEVLVETIMLETVLVVGSCVLVGVALGVVAGYLIYKAYEAYEEKQTAQAEPSRAMGMPAGGRVELPPAPGGPPSAKAPGVSQQPVLAPAPGEKAIMILPPDEQTPAGPALFPAPPGANVPLEAAGQIEKADYYNPFAGTPLEHLSVIPPGRVPLEGETWPHNRTDFDTREEALAWAMERLGAPDLLNGEPELIDPPGRITIYGDPKEQGFVTYWRVKGSTARLTPDPKVQGDEPGAHGNILGLVEHTSDPTQPPHFHLVRPPSAPRPRKPPRPTKPRNPPQPKGKP